MCSCLVADDVPEGRGCPDTSYVTPAFFLALRTTLHSSIYNAAAAAVMASHTLSFSLSAHLLLTPALDHHLHQRSAPSHSSIRAAAAAAAMAAAQAAQVDTQQGAAHAHIGGPESITTSPTPPSQAAAPPPPLLRAHTAAPGVSLATLSSSTHGTHHAHSNHAHNTRPRATPTAKQATLLAAHAAPTNSAMRSESATVNATREDEEKAAHGADEPSLSPPSPNRKYSVAESSAQFQAARAAAVRGDFGASGMAAPWRARMAEHQGRLQVR